MGGTMQGADIMAGKEFLSKLVELCPDCIIGVNRAGQVIIFNRAAEELSGLSRDEVLGKLSITEVYDPPELAREIKKKLHSNDFGGPGRVDGVEVQVKGAGGNAVPIRLSAALLSHQGREIGSVGYFHDMTARKELEEELRRRSVTDSLTGLFNRRHFHAVLSGEAERSARYGRPLTLAVFDLDNFKPFNDTHGHQEGDNILRLIAEGMNKQLRATDHAFRLGGDEFAFLMVETGLDTGVKVIERFRKNFNDHWLQKTSYLNSSLEPVTMSIGLAELLEGEKTDKLILRADLAMYEAKKAGGDRSVRAGAAIGADV